MDSFSVSTVLGPDDARALTRAAQLRVYSSPSVTKRLLLGAPMILFGLMPLAGVFWLRSDREFGAFALGMLGTVLLVAAQAAISWRRQRAATSGRLLGPTRFEFNADGFHVSRPGSKGRVSWTAVHSITHSPAHVFVWLDRATGYIVPARDLSAGLNAELVAGRLQACIAQAQDVASGIASPATDFSAPPPAAGLFPPAPGATAAQQLAAVGKLLLLMRPDPQRLVGSDRVIALLSAIALAVWLPLDGFLYTEPIEFMPDQAGGLACVIVGALALAWIFSRLSVPRVRYREALLVVSASMFIAIAGSTLFTTFGENFAVSVLILGAMTAYVMLYFKRASFVLTGFVQTRALLVGAAATFLFVVMLDRLYISPSLWVYTGDDDPQVDGGTNYQDAWRRLWDLQFDQAARIDAQVAEIGRHSAAGAQVYFVGFAGFGEQRVFAQEIDLAAKRVAERYGAADRELELVNDRRDPTKHPLATAQALRHSLVSLGKVMDADDVLFLALSSHGDEDATLSVSNSGMMPAELDADQLAESLRESGIRWKVIVISACHAGSFIDALADNHTIVVTAAAADRTSFGCSDDRDLTYFGEAFYRDALPKAASLRAAFEAAKASIAQREKAENVEASEPTAYFGAAMEAALGRLEPK